MKYILLSLKAYYWGSSLPLILPCVFVRSGLRGHAGRGVPDAAAGDVGDAGGAWALLAGGQGADEPCVRTGRDSRQLRQLEDDWDTAILQVSLSSEVGMGVGGVEPIRD